MSRLVKNVKLYGFLGLFSAIAAYTAFSAGVGTTALATSLYEKLGFTVSRVELSSKAIPQQSAPIDQSNYTFIDKEIPSKTPILRLEVFREGIVICSKDEMTPPRDFMVNAPIKGCPTLQRGDVLKATWVIINEIKVTHG